MCSFRSVSFRLGAIIESEPPTESASVMPDDIRKARAVGRRIRDHALVYIDSIIATGAKTIESHSSLGLDPTSLAEDSNTIKARFDPGLIVDFPKIRISGEQFDIEMRSCLTVCIGEQKSKIWTRCVLSRRAGMPDLDKASLKQIHAFFKDLATNVNGEVTKLYEKHYGEVHERTFDFGFHGHINLFAVDCVGVAEPLENVCTDLLINTGQKTIPNQEIAQALRSVTSFSLPDTGQDNTDSGEFALSDRSRFYAYRGLNGAGSVFVSTTEDDTAFLAGVVNSHASTGDDDELLSMGLGTTAEIATFLGSAY